MLGSPGWDMEVDIPSCYGVLLCVLWVRVPGLGEWAGPVMQTKTFDWPGPAKAQPRCRGELRDGAPEPARRQGGHWPAERGLPLTPRPLTQARRRRAPPPPRLALRRLLLLSLPSPSSSSPPPRGAARCVRGLPRGTEEGRQELWRFLSTRPESTRRQVRWGGQGSGPSQSP